MNEQDWHLEAPEDGGRILGKDAMIIANPAGSPLHPDIQKEFQHIVNCVKSNPTLRELLQRAARKLNKMDDQLLAGGNPHVGYHENDWLDQEAFALCEEITKVLLCEDIDKDVKETKND